MKLSNLDTIPVKGLKEVTNSSYVLIAILLENGARIELTQSRKTSTICLSELRAKIDGVVASITLENGYEVFKWYENSLKYKHTVDYSDPVKEASSKLYGHMKEWLL